MEITNNCRPVMEVWECYICGANNLKKSFRPVDSEGNIFIVMGDIENRAFTCGNCGLTNFFGEVPKRAEKI